MELVSNAIATKYPSTRKSAVSVVFFSGEPSEPLI